MPSSPKAKKAILQLIQENASKEVDGDIVELGSGFLTLAIAIAKQFPQLSVIAYETSTVPYLISATINYFYNGSNLTVLNQDFFKSDLSHFKFVICYLYPGSMEKLKSKFEHELKPDTLIISNTFAIPGWIPIKTLTINDLYNTKIYLYRR